VSNVIPIRDLPGALADTSFDYLLSINNLLLLEEDVLARPFRGAINFHDGPLPAYAGLNARAGGSSRARAGGASLGIS
jgi:hypothetical protein